MKHIGMVKCLYVPLDVTLLEAHEIFIKVQKVMDIKQRTDFTCGERSKSKLLKKKKHI